MKSTGMIRRLDELGRVVIPIEIRKKLDINSKDPLEIYIDGTNIILNKYEPDCIFCGNTNDVFIFKGKNVCPDCVQELKK